MNKINGTIDAGHGGKDRANKGKNGYVEADGVLIKSKYLKEELERTEQFEITLTRDKDMTLSLTERGRIASQNNADFFISEHTNAGGGEGTEVFYSVDIPTDKQFAEDMSKAISSALGIKNRGAKTRESEKYKGEDYYTVIDVAQDLGVRHVFIVESAYHDNEKEELLLLKNENLKKMAIAQAKVICNFYGVEYKEEKKVEEVINKYPLLKYGSRGEDVKTLQSKLKTLGYDITADGVFGIGTKTVIVLFQTDNKLTPDGVVGENTWTKIDGLIASQASKKYTDYMFEDCKVVEVNPLDMKIIIEDKPANQVRAKNYATSVYQTWDAVYKDGKKTDKVVSRPLGILVSDGKIISNRQPHVGFGNIKYPAGTLIVHNNGTVETKSITDINNEKNVKFAVSGCSILPNIRMKEEGFCSRKSLDGIVRDFSDVGRTTGRVCIGYNPTKKKIMIVGMLSANIGKAQIIMKKLGCDSAITLDSGGSTVLVVDGKSFTTTTRQLYAYLNW